ncbi:MAG: DUF167 domain-containing protein [Patescibacteria group bacterium]
MKIFVTVKPNSKREGVEKIDETHVVVRANAPAKEGKANKRVEELLAEYLGIAKSRIWLVSGATAHEKIFEIR